MATSQPRGLGAEGKKLWTSVAGAYELEIDEVILLTQACRTLDTIDELQRRLDAADVLDERYGGRVHPALPELRQQRLALSRLLKALDVGDADEQPKRQRRRWPNGRLRNPWGGVVVVKRIQPTEPPLELESYSLFAARHGLGGQKFGMRLRDAPGYPAWIQARQDWDARYGFPDGERTVPDNKQPPEELVDLEVWCDRRGVKFRLVSNEDSLPDYAERQEQFRAWCAERARFAAEHGWTGGREVRRREETEVTPFDLGAI